MRQVGQLRGQRDSSSKRPQAEHDEHTPRNCGRRPKILPFTRGPVSPQTVLKKLLGQTHEGEGSYRIKGKARWEILSRHLVTCGPHISLSLTIITWALKSWRTSFYLHLLIYTAVLTMFCSWFSSALAFGTSGNKLGLTTIPHIKRLLAMSINQRHYYSVLKETTELRGARSVRSSNYHKNRVSVASSLTELLYCVLCLSVEVEESRLRWRGWRHYRDSIEPRHFLSVNLIQQTRSFNLICSRLWKTRRTDFRFAADFLFVLSFIHFFFPLRKQFLEKK